MKQLSALLLAMIICTTLQAQVDFPTYYRDGAYVFDDDFKLLKNDLFTTYKSQFGLAVDDEMELVEEEFIEEYEYTYSRHQQEHMGYKVEGKTFFVQSKCGIVFVVSGSIPMWLVLSPTTIKARHTSFVLL